MTTSASPEVEATTAPPATETTPPGLTQEVITQINEAINHWDSHGYPEKAWVLRECLEQDRTPPSNLIYFGDIKPETEVDPMKLEIPPRAGSQATREVWMEFALKVTDMEASVLGSMTRDDIIHLLEVGQIIPTIDTNRGAAKTKRTSPRTNVKKRPAKQSPKQSPTS